MSDSAKATFRLMDNNFREKGPFDWATLLEWARRGRIQPTSWVWSSVDRTWRMASDIPEVAALLTPTPLLDAMSGKKYRRRIFAPQDSANRTQWEAAPTSGLAIAAFLCGIAGLWLGPLALIAIGAGHMAQWRFRHTPPVMGGFALALYGLWMGYLAIALLLFDLARTAPSPAS